MADASASRLPRTWLPGVPGQPSFPGCCARGPLSPCWRNMTAPSWPSGMPQPSWRQAQRPCHGSEPWPGSSDRWAARIWLHPADPGGMRSSRPICLPPSSSWTTIGGRIGNPAAIGTTPARSGLAGNARRTQSGVIMLWMEQGRRRFIVGGTIPPGQPDCWLDQTGRRAPPEAATARSDDDLARGCRPGDRAAAAR